MKLSAFFDQGVMRFYKYLIATALNSRGKTQVFVLTRRDCKHSGRKIMCDFLAETFSKE